MAHSPILNHRVLTAFGLNPAAPVRAIHSGHINDTFAAEGAHGSVIVQRINRRVFLSPADVVENTVNITRFLRKKILARGGDPDRETLTLLPTVDGGNYYKDSESGFWRCVKYIEDTFSHLTADGPAMLQEAGRAFGDFQQLLSDYPAASLHEILPGFHNTPLRFRQLEEAAARDAAGRCAGVCAELEFVRLHAPNCGFLTDLLAQGELPLRVTHNDTKLSNVLFDAAGKAVCVIDLDTVMPGLAAYDFGDSIRSGACTAAEDEPDPEKVRFDLNRFTAYAEGFLSAAGNALTRREIETLPDGAILITLEQGMRFLADYLNGDTYYHITHPTQNLDRARCQFRLAVEMISARAEMDRVLHSFL